MKYFFLQKPYTKKIYTIICYGAQTCFFKLSTVSTRSQSFVVMAISKLITSYIKLERGEQTLQTQYLPEFSLIYHCNTHHSIFRRPIMKNCGRVNVYPSKLLRIIPQFWHLLLPSIAHLQLSLRAQVSSNHLKKSAGDLLLLTIKPWYLPFPFHFLHLFIFFLIYRQTLSLTWWLLSLL